MNGGLVKIGGRVVFSQPLPQNIVADIKHQAKVHGIPVVDYSYDGIIYALELPCAKERFVVNDAYQSYIWEQSGNIDITPKNITKPNGLGIVCRELGISTKNIIAFGDGYNDIDMLKSANISVAMGGAPKEVCAVDTITTTTAGENGISVALRKLEIL